MALSTVATSVSHCRSCPCAPGGTGRCIFHPHQSQTPSLPQSIMAVPARCGRCWWRSTSRASVGMGVGAGESKSRSPSSDSHQQPQPGSWGPAFSSSPSSQDPVCTAGFEPGFVATSSSCCQVSPLPQVAQLPAASSFRRVVTGRLRPRG